MALTLTTAMCSSFKKELLFGVHDFATGGDTFRIGLFTDEAGATGTFGAATENRGDVTAATAEQSTSGTGYTTTKNLTSSDPVLDGTTAICDFADAEWTGSTITSFGAFIYNTTPNTASSGALTEPMVAILAFGADKSSSSGTFQVVFPNADQNNAIIRIA
jgi:hypothetical protein